MSGQDFTTTITVDKSAAEIFKAVINPRAWWSEEIIGSTEKLNDEFDYHYLDVHTCKMRLVEVIPNQKVVWLVLENYFKFTADKTEWVGNTISFEITENDGKTELVFTQHGLVPSYECFSICFDAWTTYITKSLRSLIETGQGQPNKGQDSITADLVPDGN